MFITPLKKLWLKVISKPQLKLASGRPAKGALMPINYPEQEGRGPLASRGVCLYMC